MCEQLLSVILYINWSELIKVLGAIITSIVSIYAVMIARDGLNTWKHQLKTKQKTDLLDKLVTDIHRFVYNLQSPTTYFEIVKIGFESHIPTGTKDKKQGVISYITNRGKEDSEDFIKSLEGCREKLSDIKCLVEKSQTLDFIETNNCFCACSNIIKQYESLETIAYFIKRDKQIWENTITIKMIDKILALEPQAIRESVDKEKNNFLEFTKSNYKLMYK